MLSLQVYVLRQNSKSFLHAAQFQVIGRHLSQQTYLHRPERCFAALRLSGCGFRVKPPAAEQIDFPLRGQAATDRIGGRRVQFDALLAGYADNPVYLFSRPPDANSPIAG